MFSPPSSSSCFYLSSALSLLCHGDALLTSPSSLPPPVSFCYPLLDLFLSSLFLSLVSLLFFLHSVLFSFILHQTGLPSSPSLEFLVGSDRL